MGGAANNFYRQKVVERLHHRSIITGLKLASRISKFFRVRFENILWTSEVLDRTNSIFRLTIFWII